jgi:hypothetical protein
MSWLTQHGQTLITTLCGGAVGGVLVASIEWIRTSRADQASRRSQYLSEQLRLLYGPVYCYYSRNDRLCKIWSEHSAIHKKQYIDTQYADSARDSVSEEHLAAIAVTNRYADRMVENNNKMVDILTANYGLVDPEDEDNFQNLIAHTIRYQVESREEPRPPMRVALDLPLIHFFQDEVFDAVRKRFSAKRDELRQLRQRSNSCFRRTR